jgi:hypothetical protein
MTQRDYGVYAQCPNCRRRRREKRDEQEHGADHEKARPIRGAHLGYQKGREWPNRKNSHRCADYDA